MKKAKTSMALIHSWLCTAVGCWAMMLRYACVRFDATMFSFYKDAEKTSNAIALNLKFAANPFARTDLFVTRA